VLDQRVAHVAQHCETVLRGTIELTKPVTVTHGADPFLINNR